MKLSLSDISGASYAFNKTAKTVTFTGVTLTLEKILLIVNVTAGVIIYNPFATTTKGTYAAGVLTLDFNTSAQSNTDKLLIFVDYASPDTALLTLISAAVGATLPTSNTQLAGTVTTTIANIGASASGNIPSTARSWSFVVLTGTGTLGGAALPVNFPLSDGPYAGAVTQSGPIAYTTGSASTALLTYTV